MSDDDNAQPKIDPALSDNTQKDFTPPSAEVKVDPQLTSYVQADNKGVTSEAEVRVDDNLSSTVELSE